MSRCFQIFNQDRTKYHKFLPVVSDGIL